MRIFAAPVTNLVQNIFLGCMLCLLFACAQEDYTPKKYMGLKGKVAGIRDTVYDCTLQGFHVGSGELKRVSAVDFDAEGNIIKTLEYSADSSDVDIKESVYKDHALFSSLRRWQIGRDVFTYTSERISMENGTLKYKESNGTQHWIREVKTTGKYRLEYSEGDYGYTKEESWADNDNNIVKTKSRTVSNDKKFPNGTYTFETEEKIKYDKDGNPTESVRIEDKEKTVTVYTCHRYDKYGNCTEVHLEMDGYFKRLVKRTIRYAEE